MAVPMPESTPDLDATARLIAPSMSLASCVRAYLVRNTMGRPILPAEQRVNRFPSTLLCGITWFIDGSSEVVEPADMAAKLPRVVFGGPQTRPSASFNPGPVHAFMLVLFPQAMHALTGIDLSNHANRIVAFEEAFDDEWLALSQQVLAAPDDAARIALIEQFLEPRWRAAREAGAVPGGVVGDWVNGLAAHAAAAGWGRSARKIERRIKAWVGQPLRGLRRINRAEQSFIETRASLERGEVSWAETAARGGFADQAHLCRETRAITGLTPTELARRARDDEGFWLYRIWR